MAESALVEGDGDHFLPFHNVWPDFLGNPLDGLETTDRIEEFGSFPNPLKAKILSGCSQIDE